MSTPVKDQLHNLVDQLGDEDAAEALDYLRWLLSEGEELSEEELTAARRGEEQIAAGEYTTLADLRRSLGR